MDKNRELVPDKKKEFQTHKKKVKKHTIYYDKIQCVNFQDNPLLLSYKTTLKQ